MREDNDPLTEALGRLVTTLDVIGLEAFVPEPPRGRAGRPDRRALALAFVAITPRAENSSRTSPSILIFRSLTGAKAECQDDPLACL